MSKQIYLTEQDRQRLLDSIALLRESRDKRELPHIEQLEREIERAEIVLKAQDMPGDVITMRSQVRLRDMTGGREQEFNLVYPPESDPDRGLISVLAMLGTAMLGYRVGDVFELDLPKGRKTFRVEAVLYQPESAGDYDL